jgi:hypothetical protein
MQCFIGPYSYFPFINVKKLPEIMFFTGKNEILGELEII